MSNVHLEHIDRSNWRQAINIRSTPEQVEFVMEFEPVALQILAKAYIGEGGLKWEPMAIYDGDVMVGIFALAHGEDECQVFNFLIDQSFQGSGYGTAAMNAVVDRIRDRHPDCRAITLTANAKNVRAQNFYRSNGFIATGKERVGGPIWKFEL